MGVVNWENFSRPSDGYFSWSITAQYLELWSCHKTSWGRRGYLWVMSGKSNQWFYCPSLLSLEMLVLHRKIQDTTTASPSADCPAKMLFNQGITAQREIQHLHFQEDVSQTSTKHHPVCTWCEFQACKAKIEVRSKQEAWADQGRKRRLLYSSSASESADSLLNSTQVWTVVDRAGLAVWQQCSVAQSCPRWRKTFPHLE